MMQEAATGRADAWTGLRGAGAPRSPSSSRASRRAGRYCTEDANQAGRITRTALFRSLLLRRSGALASGMWKIASGRREEMTSQ